MGLMLYPEFQKEVAGLVVNRTGEFLIRVTSQLDTIAERLSLTPLHMFDRYSGYDDYYEEVALYDGNPGDIESPAIERWFSASDGIETVDGLLDYLTSHHNVTVALAEQAFADPEAAEDIIAELEDVSQQLYSAAAQQIAFHFAVPL